LEQSKQKIWLLLVMIPFWINFLVRSYAWVIILRSQGVVNTMLQSMGIISEPLPLLYNSGSVLLGMVYTLVPFMVLPIYVSLEQMDRRKL
ncbi:ABC transporter permease, partial [Bacillus sp. SIMBA_074]